MITLYVLIYFIYVAMGFHVMDKFINKFLYKNWVIPIAGLCFMFWAFLPFLIAFDIYCGE